MVFKLWSTLRQLPPSQLAKRPMQENSVILAQLKEMEPNGNSLGFLSFVANTNQYWNDAKIKEAALSLAEQAIIKVPVTDIALSFHPKIETGLIDNGGISRIDEAFKQSTRQDKGAEKCFQQKYSKHLNLHQASKSVSLVAAN